jgi:hypothetical protein
MSINIEIFEYDTKKDIFKESEDLIPLAITKNGFLKVGYKSEQNYKKRSGVLRYIGTCYYVNEKHWKTDTLPFIIGKGGKREKHLYFKPKIEYPTEFILARISQVNLSEQS